MWGKADQDQSYLVLFLARRNRSSYYHPFPFQKHTDPTKSSKLSQVFIEGKYVPVHAVESYSGLKK